MGTNTLTPVAPGTVEPEHINDIQDALIEDLVPRDASGVPTDQAGSLGTPTIQWAEVRSKAFYENGVDILSAEVFDTRNKLISGRTRSGGSFPVILNPAGAGTGLDEATISTTTDLIFDVNGTRYTLGSDIVISGLDAAPAANNTCLVNEPTLSAQNFTRTLGEQYSVQEYITVDAMGSEITALVGTIQAFILTHSATNEYMLAYVESTTKLSQIRRGYFYDTNGTPVKRQLVSDNDVITLLKIGYVFLDIDLATADVSYKTPVWAYASPASPATGDYWYDLSEDTWKRYNGTIFISVDRTLIGTVVSNTAECIGARSEWFAGTYRNLNTAILQLDSTSTVSMKQRNTVVQVGTKLLDFGLSRVQWDMASHYASSNDRYATESASTYYFMYLDETGTPKISDIEPVYEPVLKGFYFPHNTWRACGRQLNNSSSNFVFNPQWYGNDQDDLQVDYAFVNGTAASQAFTTAAGWELVNLGASISINEGSILELVGETLTFHKIGWYEICLYITAESNHATGAALMDFRLKNNLTALSVHTFGQIQCGGNTNNNRANFMITGRVFISHANVGLTYQIEVDTTTNAANILNFSLSAYRMPMVYIQ